MKHKLLIEYDGTNYCGWQRQDKSPSIQGSIESAIKKFCGNKITVHGAGRTDAGVHASGQVAHISLEKKYDDKTIMQAINFYLKDEPISILAVTKVEEDFDARFSAIKRYYRYKIINRQSPLTYDLNKFCHINIPLDLDNMEKSIKSFVGKHDFTTFRSSSCQSKSPIKRIEEIIIKKHGNRIFIDFIARSFLQTQVRSMMGCIIKVGIGSWDVNKIPELIKAKDRTQCAKLASSCGLYLTRIDYPE
ncbi:MAG: tRNA pseudouridine(38-40) synthase TruA [Hyphomicrobiales bacterium]|jgi:tRNA pseudouridine38-40 synthase|nr:tRNA pseudouridine(38-40) synthase TruA [Hyphomicrobiales bacterium]